MVIYVVCTIQMQVQTLARTKHLVRVSLQAHVAKQNASAKFGSHEAFSESQPAGSRCEAKCKCKVTKK